MTSVAIDTTPTRRAALAGATSAKFADVPSLLDSATLVAAYVAHRADAYRCARRILRDSASAEDAVQDAFFKLWTGSQQFDPLRGSMRGLILTIARHTSIDTIRRSANRKRVETTYCADRTYVTEGPERETARGDDARRVRDALATLPDEQRSAIEAAHLSGLTRREIAARARVPIGTVKSRMRLGMKKLAASLADPNLQEMREVPAPFAVPTCGAGGAFTQALPRC